MDRIPTPTFCKSIKTNKLLEQHIPRHTHVCLTLVLELSVA